MMRVINVDDVTVVKNGNIILDNISFDIEMGSFVSLIGNNGSGKSSLIKVMAGLCNYNGYININGYYLDDIQVNDIRKIMSVVFDDIDEEILGNTVWDNLVMSLIHLGKSDKYIKRRIGEVCSLFDIDKGLLNKKMILLDSEDKNKVLIASAVMSKPSILLLDDCLSMFSYKNKKKIMNILNRLCKEDKMTIIMATNDLDLIFNTSKVMILLNGRLVANGPVKNVFKNKKDIKKYSCSLPFIVDLSMKLIDKGIINNIYLDERKLVDALWK